MSILTWNLVESSSNETENQGSYISSQDTLSSFMAIQQQIINFD